MDNLTARSFFHFWLHLQTMPSATLGTFRLDTHSSIIKSFHSPGRLPVLSPFGKERFILSLKDTLSSDSQKTTHLLANQNSYITYRMTTVHVGCKEN